MNKLHGFHLFEAALICLLLINCNGNSHISPQQKPLLKVIEKKVDASTFSDIANIRRVVKLENQTDALFGEVSRVMVSQKGDIYVGDFSASQSVIRFDRDGNFIERYSRKGQGPGEYEMLQSFTVMDDSSLILLSPDKIIKLDPNGQFQKEVKITTKLLGEITANSDRIYVRILRDRTPTEQSHEVMVFDTSLNQIHSFSTYDNRLNKYIYGLWQGMAWVDNNVYLAPFYSLGFTSFNSDGELRIRHELENSNNELESIWNKENFTEQDREQIKTQLHRFHGVASSGSELLLFESQRKTFDRRTLVFSPQTGVLTKIFGYHIINRDTEPGNLGFLFVGDGRDGSFIGVLDDPQYFSKVKESFKPLQNIEFNTLDNLILVFFEFNGRVLE